MNALVLSAWAAKNRQRTVILVTSIDALVPGGLLYAGGQFIPLAANEAAYIETRLTLHPAPAPA